MRFGRMVAEHERRTAPSELGGCRFHVVADSWQTSVSPTRICLFPSGRRDLNPGPLGPEPSALAGLRYAPMYCIHMRYTASPELTSPRFTACLKYKKSARNARAVAFNPPLSYIVRMGGSKMKAQFSFRTQSLITRTTLFGLAFLGGTLAVGTSPLPGSAHSALCPTDRTPARYSPDLPPPRMARVPRRDRTRDHRLDLHSNQRHPT